MNESINPLAALGWTASPGFTQAQLDLLAQTGKALSAHAESILPGRAADWMRRWLSPVRFHRGGLPQWIVTRAARQSLSVVFPRRDIWLSPDFDAQSDPVQHLLHELAHVIDNTQSTRAFPATIRGRGPADRLVHDLGGLPLGIRFSNGSCGLPALNLWSGAVNAGYGNSASAEYFAEAFAWSVIHPVHLPSPAVEPWLKINVFLAATMREP